MSPIGFKTLPGKKQPEILIYCEGKLVPVTKSKEKFFCTGCWKDITDWLVV